MKLGFLKLLGVAFCLSALAFAQDVKYNFDRSTNFSKYHTYKWVEIGHGAAPNQLVDSQIKAAIDMQLAAKGLTKSDTNPDILVGYQISVDKEKQWDAYGDGGFRIGGGFGTVTSSTLNVGTLALDFYDPATKMLVWRGTATKTIDPSGNPNKNQERLQKAMAKLLKNFPPPLKG